MQRTDQYKPELFWFSVFAFFSATILLYKGAFTTSIGAGMAFPDWPLSHGSLNPEGWTQQPDQFAEHGHRLLGMFLGALAIILVYMTYVREARKEVRYLAVAILYLIISQGLLGGLRVLFDNTNTGWDVNTVAQTFAVLHAMGAELVVCLLVCMAVLQSNLWINRQAGLSGPCPRKIQIAGLVACGAILIQILIGAVMRHIKAGYAIPYFPHSTVDETGALGWLPPIWNFPVSIHFAHRVGAIIVLVSICVYFYLIWANSNTKKAFMGKSLLMLGLLFFQILLGATTIWKALHPHVTSLHMLTGAFLLAATWMLTFLSFRFSVNRPSPFLDDNTPKDEESTTVDPARTQA